MYIFIILLFSSFLYSAPPVATIPLGSNALTEDLTAHYRLNGDGSDNLGGAALTPTDGAFETGKFGQAYDVDANGEYLADTVGGNCLNGADDATVIIWLKFDSVGDSQYIHHGYGNIGDFYHIGAILGIYWYYSASADIIQETLSLDANTWYMIAATRERNGACYNYINGVWVTSGTATDNALSSPTQKGKWLNNINGTAPIKGKGDEIMLWRRALSAGEIKYIYYLNPRSESR